MRRLHKNRRGSLKGLWPGTVTDSHRVDQGVKGHWNHSKHVSAAALQGVSGIACTPHCANSRWGTPSWAFYDSSANETDAVSMPGQRQRSCPSIKPASGCFSSPTRRWFAGQFASRCSSFFAALAKYTDLLPKQKSSSTILTTSLCGDEKTVVDHSQQTRKTEPMVFQCWASVEDGGPTLKQHWFGGRECRPEKWGAGGFYIFTTNFRPLILSTGDQALSYFQTRCHR